MYTHPMFAMELARQKHEQITAAVRGSRPPRPVDRDRRRWFAGSRRALATATSKTFSAASPA